MKNLILMLCLFFTQNSFAKLWSLENFKTLSAGFGTWLEFYNEMQTNQNGDLNNDFEFTPTVFVSTEYKLPYSQFIIPEFGYVFQEKDSDGKSSINRFIFSLDYAYMPIKWLRLRAGSSFIFQNMTGDGSSKTLPNGSGTETYYAPEESQTSINQSIDLTAEFLYERVAAKIKTYTYAIGIEEERMTTIALSLNYRIPFREL